MLTPKKGPAKPKSGSTDKKTTVKKGYAPNQSVSNYIHGKNDQLSSRAISTNASGKKDYINTSNNKFTSTGSQSKNKTYDAFGKPTYRTSSDNFNNNKKTFSSTDNFKKSMDTTGYAAGKKDFTINSITKSPGKLTTTKSVKIKRDQVAPELQKWKKAASKMHKKGGVVKSKKK